MGLSPFSCNKPTIYCDRPSCNNYGPPPVQTGNPNPYNFFVKKSFEHNRYVLVWIRYPDCHNFDGNKILLIDNQSKEYEKCLKNKKLDPHFLEENHIIARFRPEEQYFSVGKALIYEMSQNI